MRAVPEVGFKHGGQHGDGGGLAGAVGPEQAEHFAFFDGEADPLDSLKIAELFGQVIRFEDCGHWSTPFVSYGMITSLLVRETAIM